MQTGKIYANKLVPDIGPNGDCYGYKLAKAEIQIKDIEGLLSELDSLKAENAQLREWISWGKYSR